MGRWSKYPQHCQYEWTHLWSGQTYTFGAQGKTFTEADAKLGFPPVYVDMSDPSVAGAVDAPKGAGVIAW